MIFSNIPETISWESYWLGQFIFLLCQIILIGAFLSVYFCVGFNFSQSLFIVYQAQLEMWSKRTNWREEEQNSQGCSSVHSSENCEHEPNVILGRKLIFSQTYFFSESDPTIVASSEGLIIQQSHCAMTHFPPPNLGIKKESEILPLTVWLGGVIYCHQIRLSHHNIVILCWWSLAQRSINTLIACLQ